MRRLLTVPLVVLAAAAAAFALAGAGGGEDGKRSYRIVFDNAFGLVAGGDFRVGGVRAGQTSSFDVKTSRTGPPKAVVTATVDEEGVPAFRTDATCSVKPQSLIGEYFVDCQPGTASERLADDDAIPVTQTEGTIPIDLIQNVLRRPARERLRVLVAGLGTGLAGRSDDLQEVLRRLHPGMRETSKVLRILGDESRTIQQFIADADTVFTELDGSRRDARRFVTEGADLAETVASRRDAVRESVRRTPEFLAQLRPSLVRLGELAGQSEPLLADLQRAAPDLETVLDRLGPFAATARPALRELGDAAVPATQALREGRDELDELSRLAADAPATAKPLRQLLQSLDDRKRAIDNDPRAKVNGPPPTDPSYGGGRGGFTGIESIGNYFFWQVMSTNVFDNLGHLLRVGATTNKCSPFTNDVSNKQLLEDCNSWLGPRQPGINAPDPGQPSPAAAGVARESEKPAKRRGERRGPGEPDAGPVPGQRDISKPQVGLPPSVEDLLERLPKLSPPKVPNLPNDQSTDDLLDFLLAP